MLPVAPSMISFVATEVASTKLVDAIGRLIASTPPMNEIADFSVSHISLFSFGGFTFALEGIKNVVPQNDCIYQFSFGEVCRSISFPRFIHLLVSSLSL